MNTELFRGKNKPLITKRPACEDEEDGIFTLDYLKEGEEYPKSWREFWGNEGYGAEKLNWLFVKSYSKVVNREVFTTTSTDECPIFARRCLFKSKIGSTNFFYKIYIPYYSSGKGNVTYLGHNDIDLNDYLNGLYELKEIWKYFNRSVVDYDCQKIEAAYFCTTDIVAAMLSDHGKYPIWYNSDDLRLSFENIKEICKYVKRLYLIPEINWVDTKDINGKLKMIHFNTSSESSYTFKDIITND